LTRPAEEWFDAGSMPERSLSLAGSFVKARYRVNAVASVSRDVVVYTAEELRHGRPIALKVLRDDVAADAEFVAAVRDRASTLAMSAHVHRGLPRVYECGVTDTGELFIALEQTKGVSLREVLDARGALDPSTALRIASHIGEALETLHHDGIVHGELGPESVLLVRDDDGVERVTLVGVEVTAAYRTTAGRRRREASPPAYVAPEQVERGEATEATDQYALGMLLREMLTPGWRREPPGARTAVPPDIERITTTALDPRPEQRYPDISVMVNDMWAAQTAFAELAPRPPAAKARASGHRRPRPHKPHLPLRIAGAVVTGGIIAVVVWLALSGGIVSRFRAAFTAPTATAVPVERAPAVVDRAEPPHPAAAPRPAPVVEQSERPAAPVPVERPRPAVESRAPAERSAPRGQRVTDPADGGAIIDWLLKNRR
jgi:protein kinase-like protein